MADQTFDKLSLAAASPAEQFAAIVTSGVADSAIIVSADGQRLYPIDARPLPTPPEPGEANAQASEISGAFRHAAREWATVAKAAGIPKHRLLPGDLS